MRVFKVIGSVLILIFFTQCKGYNVRYDYDEKQNNYFEVEFLQSIGAEENKYAVLYIGGGFYDDHLIITQEDVVLFDGRISSQPVTGFSRALRVERDKDIKIVGLNRRRLKISKKEISRYKYIYFGNIYVLKKYSILYSNTLFGNM